MSFMRYPVYAWSDGHLMHLWIRENPELDDSYSANELLGTDSFPDFRCGIQMPQDVFDYLEKCDPQRLAKIQRKLDRQEAKATKMVEKHLAKKAKA